MRGAVSSSSSSRTKVFNDPIHGHIELSELCIKIIDTPQFQRLRYISQLGGIYFVFPGASSHRFEHSIGVSHLAREFATNLRIKQPGLGITDADILCVEIAGLVHDIGHGPFSHLYDGKFLPAIHHNHSFAHEHASIGLLDLLIEQNDLRKDFTKHGLGDDDIQFIKELMLGDRREGPMHFKWYGRGEKNFLYDIVANKRNGIDVDKFDYFARDCHVLGLTKSFDCKRLMKFAMVFRVNRKAISSGQSIARDSSSNGPEGVLPALEICYHTKEAWNIFELFHTRYALHKRAYQHRVCRAVELMIVEVMLLADPHLLFRGTGGQLRRMSECHQDMEAYWQLSDCILKQIETSYSEELSEARALLLRLRRRDLFALVGEVLLSNQDYEGLLSSRHDGVMTSMIIRKEVYESIRSIQYPDEEDRTAATAAACCPISENDLFCEIIKMNYGKGILNPVDGPTAFYRPKARLDDDDGDDMDDDHEGDVCEGGTFESMDEQDRYWSVGVMPQDAVSRVTPREFEETYVRVYCRYKLQKKVAMAGFKQWCERNRVKKLSTPLKRPRRESGEMADLQRTDL